jgi:biopolymer transport protein ExbD
MPERREVKTPEKVDIQMTPMIDIVFQLMAFFLMTFKVATVEGDFNLKLPKQERSQGVANTQAEMITVTLRAKPNGQLLDMIVGSARFVPKSAVDKTPYRDLNGIIAEKVAAARRAEQDEPEIQIDVDDILAYENIIDTIEAVSVLRGVSPPQPLAKKVKFAPKAP